MRSGRGTSEGLASALFEGIRAFTPAMVTDGKYGDLTLMPAYASKG